MILLDSMYIKSMVFYADDKFISSQHLSYLFLLEFMNIVISLASVTTVLL